MQMVDPDIGPRASSSQTRSPSGLGYFQWPESFVLVAAGASLMLWLTIIINGLLAPTVPVAAVTQPEIPRQSSSSGTTSRSSSPQSALAQENN